ncbi:hypothetical protein DQP55_18350 [Mycolicibacterium sp. GF69]|nr:hypothetical protein DQP55_18350 [Mycolicibacterium sp. GF69]
MVTNPLAFSVGSSACKYSRKGVGGCVRGSAQLARFSSSSLHGRRGVTCAQRRSPQPGILVEAESFDDHGGWMLNSQFDREMGSPYLLAHDRRPNWRGSSGSGSLPILSASELKAVQCERL